MDVAAIVFDLDDTLYPERQYAHGGFAAVAKAFAGELGSPSESFARMKRLLDSEHRPRVFDALLDELAIADHGDLVARMIDAYRRHPPAIRLFEGVDALLDDLRQRRRLGLLTDGRPAAQWAKIDILGLRNRFDAIVVTSELGPAFGKPSTRPFEMMSEKLNSRGSNIAYVADNPCKDFIGPNALGWRTIQVRRADGLYAHEQAAPGGTPQLVIDSLDALREWAKPAGCS
jgi:putative hydrolase of the HAD superfamily